LNTSIAIANPRERSKTDPAPPKNDGNSREFFSNNISLQSAYPFSSSDHLVWGDLI